MTSALKQRSTAATFLSPSTYKVDSAAESDEMIDAATPALLPPPPPPPPLPSSVRQETPTSTPRSRLRRLQWVKIPAGRVSGGGRNVWTDADNRFGSSGSPPRLDFAEMEDLFRVAEPSASVNGVVRRQYSDSPSEDVSITDRQRNRDEIILLDSKRSLNVNIFVRQFHQSLSAGDIITRLLTTATGSDVGGRGRCADAETLTCLLKIAPDDDEAQRLRAFSGDARRLGTAERFLLELISLPNYRVRVEATLLKEEFGNTVDCLRPCLDAVILTARAIKESTLLRELIYMILAAGNFLNMGGYAGNAVGFKLDSLLKLTDIRANRPNMNLLHYVAMQAEAKNQALLELPRQFPCLKEAAQYTSETLSTNVAELNTRLKTIASRIEQTADVQLQQQFRGFLETAADELDELQRDMADLDQLRRELGQYFCEDETTFKLDDCIKTFSAFFDSFLKAIQENEQRREQQRKAEERRQQREQQISARQSQSAGGPRTVCGMRRLSRSCWRDDKARESPADIDDAASSSSCTWRSTSRCSSAAGDAVIQSSSSAETVEDVSRSSPPSSLSGDGHSTALPRRHHRSRSAVDRAYSPVDRPTDGRNWLPTHRCSDFPPSDDLLDFLQQEDRGPGTCDCTASVNNCFGCRVGSLRRRRRSAVTPELMQMDRERATASPTAATITQSSSQQGTATPDPPPRPSRRRLLPQPDRAAALELAARNRDAGLCRSASAVSSRYFVPISNRQDQQRESNTPSFRRLPLVNTSVGGTSASLAASASVAVSTTAEPHGRPALDEVAAVTSVHENRQNSSSCPSHVVGRRDNAEVLASATHTPPSRPHREHTSTVHANDNDDDDKLFDLPDDELGQQSTRFTFRSSTLPRRWKWHHPNEESSKPTDRRDCRELWTTCKDALCRTTEPESSTSSNSSSQSTQPQATSSPALARVEAMKDRFRRLSEMYKNSLEEDSATTFTKTKKTQNNDVGKDIECRQSTGDTDNTETEVGSKTTSVWKTATTVASDTESLSSCGRDEGFESETATSSVVYRTDDSCPESHCLAVDVTASTPTKKNAATTEAVATGSSEAILFASSFDSIIQQTSSTLFNGLATRDEVAAADASPSSSLGTLSTDEVARCSGTLAQNDDTASPSRLSRVSQQKAFSERMSAPRRSVTRSPQRRTTASSSDATSRAGLYGSPVIRRKTTATTTSGPSPPPRDYAPLATGTELRRRADASEVDGTSRFVRGSVTRASLPHSGVYVRAVRSARPTNSQDHKQTLTSPRTSSSFTHRSASKIQDGQTVKAATGLCHTPVVTHVDRNGVQAKPSSAARVFSTPVRFGPTSHATRPARTAAAEERPNAAGGDSAPSKQTGRALSTDRHSDRRNHQQTAESGPEVTSTPRISERKSVFERLFEISHHQRHSKPGASSVAPGAGGKTGCKQGQAAESHKKLSSNRPSTSSTNSARQSANSSS